MGQGGGLATPLAHLVQDHHDGDADASNCDGEDHPRRKHKNSKERMLMSIVQTNDHSMENLGEDSINEDHGAGKSSEVCCEQGILLSSVLQLTDQQQSQPLNEICDFMPFLVERSAHLVEDDNSRC